MIGLFEAVCAPWKVEGIPDDFSFGELPPDWDRMAPVPRGGDEPRARSSLDAGIRTFFCGPESFTPDLRRSSARRRSCATTSSPPGSTRSASSPAAASAGVLAHWIVDGGPDVDVTGMQHRPPAPATRRTPSTGAPARSSRSGMVYQCHYPDRSMQTARGAKLSPLHDRLAPQRRVLQGRQRLGGRRLVRRPGDVEPDAGPLTWGRPNWLLDWEAEHRACREGVIVMDMSFMSKFRVQGRDAGRVLDHISANDVDGEAGPDHLHAVAQRAAALLEADLTVTKLDDEQFLVVASDTAHRHVETHAAAATSARRTLSSPTSPAAYAQINVQGPRSRELLQTLTDADLSNDGVPVPRRARDRHRLRARAVRAHHLPRRAGLRALRAGRAGGPRVRPDRRLPVRRSGCGTPGSKALASLRMEKGYRDYGHDIDNTDSVARGRARLRGRARQAGRLHRPRRGARAEGRPARCARGWCRCWCLDPEPLMFHAEVVRRDGAPVGYVRAASYGHTLGGAVGLAMVEGGGEAITSDVARRRGSGRSRSPSASYPATTSLRPLYDPDNSRIRS